MEWMIFILVAWAAVRFLGVGRCSGNWQLERRRRLQEQAAATRAKKVSPPAPQAATAAETLEARLRSRYVDGELSVEQYERELDALYRRSD